VYCFGGDVGLSERIDQLGVSDFNATAGNLRTSDAELAGRIGALNTTYGALKAKENESGGRIEALNTADDELKTVGVPEQPDAKC